MQQEYEWDSSHEWPERWLRWLMRTVIDDWRNERVSRDFFDKLQARGFTRQHIWTVIKSQETFIGRYWYYDSNRVGFWHPRSQLFIVWKPNTFRSSSRLMTGFFYRGNGVAYMRKFEPFREIRGPKK